MEKKHSILYSCLYHSCLIQVREILQKAAKVNSQCRLKLRDMLIWRLQMIREYEKNESSLSLLLCVNYINDVHKLSIDDIQVSWNKYQR
jgi:hypothetical protein